MRKKIEKVLPLLIIFLINFLILRPVLSLDSFFSVHDQTWLIRLQQFAKAIELGQFPPRLAPNMAWGYGYPIYRFYAPMFTFISWLFYLISRNFVVGVLGAIFFSNFIGAVGLYFLAKRFWGRQGGLLSSALFILMPYRALDIFVRGAFAELLALNVFPWLIYFYLRLMEGKLVKKGDFLGLVFSLTVIVLSHNPFWIMLATLAPVFLISLKFTNIFKKRRRLLFAILLALALSCFFWMPLFFDLNEIIGLEQAGKTNYKDHFVLLRQIWDWPWGFGGSAPGLADGLSFKVGKSHLLLGLIGMVLAVYHERKNGRLPKIIFMFALGAMALFLSLPMAGFFWDNLPALSLVQFPWRFLGIFGLVLSFFSGAILMNLRIGWLKLFSLVSLVVLITLTGYFNLKYFVSNNTIANAQEHLLNKENIANSALSVAEYFPKKATPPDRLPENVAEMEGLEIIYESPFAIKFRLDEKNKIVFKRFYFSGWKGDCNGQTVSVSKEPKTGLIKFSGKPGQCQLFFRPTNPEIFAWSITAIAILIVFIYWLY